MTITTETPTTSRHHRKAQLITDYLHPKTWIVVVFVLTGWHAAGWTGTAWSVIGVLFAAVLPMAFVKYGIRKGWWADHNVGVRQSRMIALPVILGSVLAGLALMAVLDAPGLLVTLIVSMMVTLIALIAITAVWKISVHQAVSAGTVGMLAVMYGPWALLGYLLVGIVGWSRVALRHHTLAQVAAGTVLGSVVAAAVFALLR